MNRTMRTTLTLMFATYGWVASAIAAPVGTGFTYQGQIKQDGVPFEYRDPDSINEPHGTRIGMIAQEVEEVFPDWVKEGGHGYKTLTFRGFEAITVEALRELREEKDRQLATRDAELAEQHARLNEQQQQINRLAEQLERIEAMLGAISTNNVIGGIR